MVLLTTIVLTNGIYEEAPDEWFESMLNQVELDFELIHNIVGMTIFINPYQVKNIYITLLKYKHKLYKWFKVAYERHCYLFVVK